MKEILEKSGDFMMGKVGTNDRVHPGQDKGTPGQDRGTPPARPP